jgi:hypothetical protein
MVMPMATLPNRHRPDFVPAYPKQRDDSRLGARAIGSRNTEYADDGERYQNPMPHLASSGLPAR